MPKIKTGEEITWKEFFHRWKLGIEGITPAQQVMGQLQSSYIISLGLGFGIFFSAISLDTLWWLLIILIGAFYNNVIQILALNQKRKQIKQFENMYNQAIMEVEQNGSR